MVKPKALKTDYSKIAEYYDRVRPVPAPIWLSKIIEYGEIEANSTVLDVGCGTGRFPLGISAAKNLTFCALEPSVEMLKQALTKAKSRTILWVCGDGQQLPFPNGFDCVYMTLVIHHIENREEALRETYRVLKKDGRCVIMTNSHSRIKKHVLRDFPGITAIDLKRFPSLLFLKKTMIHVGFTHVRRHAVQQDEESMPTEEYLERVRNKYISTLTLLSEEAFQRGLKVFEQKVRRKHGRQIRRVPGFDFIVGCK